jgi:hypothetical protein
MLEKTLNKVFFLIKIIFVILTSLVFFALLFRVISPNMKGISNVDLIDYFKFSILLICFYILLKIIKKRIQH